MDNTSMLDIPLFERLEVETISHCNRHCWFCPRTHDRSGKYFDQNGTPVQNRMPTETVMDILDQAEALGFRKSVAFYNYSEPLLDKRHLLFAREAKKRGMHPYMHTNGDVLKTDSALCKQVANLYERIVVSLYDYRTQDELEETKRFWQGRLKGANLEFNPIGVDGSMSGFSAVVPRALVPSDGRIRVPDLVYVNGPCYRPMIRMIIQHDGNVCNCCEDTTGVFDLGNVYENSLEEIWYSKHHIGIVNDLIAGHREKYDLCRNCPLSPSGPLPGGAQLEIARRKYRAED